VCNVIVVQRVINAALGGPCVTSTSHGASLSWVASTSSNVVGYNVYRATTLGGPYTKLNASLVAVVSYSDSAVQAGQTYFYVVTAVDNNNNESTYSTAAQATIPTP
jgi:fibronectin type 3 domain-containing protein